MLIITTKGDNQVINELELKALIDYHNIQHDNIIHFNCLSRLPMITKTKELNESLYNWIESIS